MSPAGLHFPTKPSPSPLPYLTTASRLSPALYSTAYCCHYCLCLPYHHFTPLCFRLYLRLCISIFGSRYYADYKARIPTVAACCCCDQLWPATHFFTSLHFDGYFVSCLRLRLRLRLRLCLRVSISFCPQFNVCICLLTDSYCQRFSIASQCC
ncbi:hypothetical protein CFO_g1017 [Ceratocystis platani]|uniref:Uncharacterized protein n=1 Tax=Ceratocystis fimbriata f. sp. platani TaxID=88771 RepID=A0A0F8DL88_CERFI|nr:hypothetical protein CFO_g1017 [Ceratocystis platani]